jgi:hypothetical protein
MRPGSVPDATRAGGEDAVPTVSKCVNGIADGFSTRRISCGDQPAATSMADRHR